MKPKIKDTHYIQGKVLRDDFETYIVCMDRLKRCKKFIPHEEIMKKYGL